MSQRLRCLHLSLRALEKAPVGALRMPARTLPASRRALHASTAARSAQPAHAFRQDPEALFAEAYEAEPPTRAGRRNAEGTPAHETWYAPEDAHVYSANKRNEVSQALAAHLNRLLRPLEFPPELARRILTHASHRDAVHGHNQRLSFMGRRALEAYFMLFLHGTPNAPVHADHASITERALNSYAFGEHIAGRWELGRVIRWTPPDVSRAPHHEPAPRGAPFATRGVGLYKVTGTAVEAVMGGVFHQFGGNVAHKLFHTRILPRLPHLPEPFRTHAHELCERMGGENAPLLVRASRPAGKPQASSSTPEPQLAPGADVGASAVKAEAPHLSASASPQAAKISRQPAGAVRERVEDPRTDRKKLAL